MNVPHPDPEKRTLSAWVTSAGVENDARWGEEVDALQDADADAEAHEIPEDTLRFNWLERAKDNAKGWALLLPGDGWEMKVLTYGPHPTLRKAIDNVRMQ